MTVPETYTGKDATIEIGLLEDWATGGTTHTEYAISDFGITITRGTVTQELVGATGDFQIAGALAAEGSLTACRLGIDTLGILLESIINGTAAKRIFVKGMVGPNSVNFEFKECQVVSFELTIGDASTISEGSVDFKVMKPYLITLTETTGAGTLIKDYT